MGPSKILWGEFEEDDGGASPRRPSSAAPGLNLALRAAFPGLFPSHSTDAIHRGAVGARLGEALLPMFPPGMFPPTIIRRSFTPHDEYWEQVRRLLPNLSSPPSRVLLGDPDQVPDPPAMNPTRWAPASFRDRTNEFRSAVEGARRPHQPALAKRTSVFDDPTLEIQELTAVIKKDTTALNTAVVDLQVLCNSQNESGNLSKDTTNHSTTVVDNLKNHLMSATKEFKEVLTMRTENLKVHENIRQMFSSSAAKDASNPFIRQRPLVAREASDSSAPPAPWASDSASTPLFQRKKTDGDHGASSSSSLSPAFMQQQQQLAVQQDSYMQSRAEALQNVESTIHELSNIFTQLATVVSQQGELAIRIDENMDETPTNVEGAQGQLLKYLNSISSNKWLMMKIFFVLMVFLMIFIFFVA